MTIKSLRIPLGFLVAGIIWAIFSNRFIFFVTKDLTHDTHEVIRSFNHLIFVVIISIALYFRIKKQYSLLIASKDQYRNLFEINPSPMWINNAETLRFVKVNAAAIELYGYNRNEFLAMTVKDIRPESEYLKFLNYKRTSGDGIRRAGTWKHIKKDGEGLLVSIVTHNLLFNNEPCSLVIATDVTEMILKEEKIKAQNKTLQGIAWSNSHEVRRPLCSIISLATLLKESKNENEKGEYLDLLLQCTAELDEALMKTSKKVDELGKSR